MILESYVAEYPPSRFRVVVSGIALVADLTHMIVRMILAGGIFAHPIF